jgi:hypothetical protein
MDGMVFSLSILNNLHFTAAHVSALAGGSFVRDHETYIYKDLMIFSKSKSLS